MYSRCLLQPALAAGEWGAGATVRAPVARLIWNTEVEPNNKPIAPAAVVCDNQEFGTGINCQIDSSRITGFCSFRRAQSRSSPDRKVCIRIQPKSDCHAPGGSGNQLDESSKRGYDRGACQCYRYRSNRHVFVRDRSDSSHHLWLQHRCYDGCVDGTKRFPFLHSRERAYKYFGEAVDLRLRKLLTFHTAD
jgi:hypothetical protein